MPRQKKQITVTATANVVLALAFSSSSSSGPVVCEKGEINEQGAVCSHSQQMLEGFQAQPGFLFYNVPRSQRSNRRANKKMKEEVDSGDLEEGAKQKRPSKTSSNGRRRGTRKRKSKLSVDTSDSEGYTPRFRIRGQLRRSLDCSNSLKERRKLDDSTFQCYMENIWSGFSEDKRNSFAYLDSVWFCLYIKGHLKEKVLNWIKRRDIFSKKYVFVPIVLWSHWSLLIFCHFGEGPASKTRSPCMLLLDSLQLTDPKRLEPGIRRFVLDLHKSEDRPGTKESIRKLPLLVPKVPQQKNGEECGYYLLYYINSFLENAPDNFNISEYPYFMKEGWFTIEELDNFCKRLDSIPKDSCSAEDD